jgi:hypothetical protein
MKAPLSDVLRNVINPLAFTRLEYLSEYRVVYIDTERDYKELLPDTFNSIRTLSQIQDIDEFTSKFTMTSVLEISRTDRLDFIRVLLDRESKKFSKDEKTNLIVVLDVISDLTTNFNDIDSTYALSDFLTQMNNIYGVTFICVIHENPDAKSNKARGHLGTEISNKASRILQVALNGKKNTLDQLKITCLKSRNTAEFNPISAYYSPEHSRLIRFIPDETSVIKVANNIKASPNEVVQYLEEILEVGNDYKKSYLFPLLEKKFNVKARTIEDKLKVITDNLITFKINDDAYVLTTRVENKFKIYNLERKI